MKWRRQKNSSESDQTNMAEPGYVYALINYSMPGLLKIGRTAKAPAERGQELSGATGVPTPFVLLFDIFVPDSATAEAYIHRALENAGFRHSQGREFFSVPPDLAIRLLLAVRDGSDTPTVRLPRQIGGDPFGSLSGVSSKAASALLALGYSPELAREAVTEAAAVDPTDDVAGLVRKALEIMDGRNIPIPPIPKATRQQV